MSEIAPFISDLAVILIAAGIFTLLFKRLRQPVILGYIVAGLVAGPAVPWVPSVTDPANIKIWADIGVIFLLFAMGLEFSFRKLLHIGGTAVIAAATIVTGMMTAGCLAGHLLGFSHLSSLFLGGMLSMSSTAIVFKAFDDMRLHDRPFANVVMGILVIEDLVAVVLMVLLSTLAVSRHFEGARMAASILKLAGFLLFWSLSGIYLLPNLLRKMRKTLNDETLLIVALGLCLGMVMIAVKAGFSSALGAFVMGSLLAETAEAVEIEKLLQPVKNLFGAVFFVSVGMMIDPGVLTAQWLPILLLTLVVLGGQVFFGTLGVVLSGQTLHTAMQAGFSLTQVGEFAFIIASLGLTLGVTDGTLYPVIVAVSVLTTFLTPYMIRSAEPAYRYADRKLPLAVKRLLARCSSGTSTVRQKSAWHRLLRSMLPPVALYTVLCLMVQGFYFRYAAPVVAAHLPGLGGSLVNLALLLPIIAPFLWMIFMKKNRSAEFMKLWNDSRFNRGPLVSLIVLKSVLCIGILMSTLIRLFNVAAGAGFALSLVILCTLIFSRRIRKHSLDMEHRFLENFHGSEKTDAPQQPAEEQILSELPFEHLHLAEFTLAPSSPLAGSTLHESRLRQRYGISVVAITRGHERINIPGGGTRLYPCDKLTVVGTAPEIDAFRKIDDEDRARERTLAARPLEKIRIERFRIDEASPLVGYSIRETELRTRVTCLLLGIERRGETLMNPPADTRFEADDVVWLAGESGHIRRLSEKNTE